MNFVASFLCCIVAWYCWASAASFSLQYPERPGGADIQLADLTAIWSGMTKHGGYAGTDLSKHLQQKFCMHRNSSTFRGSNIVMGGMTKQGTFRHRAWDFRLFPFQVRNW